jgi:Mg2+/Co2+ transporter CorB
VIGTPLHWIVLPSLMATSAFFSSSETALFSLDERGRASAGPTVKKLLEEPQALLVTLLLSNLIVNVLFFAFAADLAASGSAVEEVLYSLGAVFALVLVGELIPKRLPCVPIRVSRGSPRSRSRRSSRSCRP